MWFPNCNLNISMFAQLKLILKY